MKKSIILLLSVVILLGLCTTLEAQSNTASHDIEITVDEVADLSITGSDSVTISCADWSGDSLTNEWKAFSLNSSTLSWLSVVEDGNYNKITVQATDIPSGLKLRVSLNNVSESIPEVVIGSDSTDLFTNIASESDVSYLYYEVGITNIENVRASSNSSVNITYTIQDEIS